MQLLKIAFTLACVLFLEIATNENQAEAACPEDSLPCDDGLQCVKRHAWCDRNNHCQDGSDERYCKKRHFFSPDPNKCKDTHFLCDDGRCLPLVAKCDGHIDCGDRSDEICRPEPAVDYNDYDTDQLETTTEHTISEPFSGFSLDISDEEDTPNLPILSTVQVVRENEENPAHAPIPVPTRDTPLRSPNTPLEFHYKRIEEDRRESGFQPPSLSVSSYVSPVTTATVHGPGAYQTQDAQTTTTSACNGGGFLCENPIPTTRSSYSQYRPSSSISNCLPRSSYCNGQYECSNKRDEYYCDDYGTQYHGGCPRDWWKCDDGRCIPSEWKCNGFVDCLDESDEYTCSYLKKNQVIITQAPPTIATISARDGRTLGDGLTKRKLLDWFMGRRKIETVTNKWGHELPRIAIALFLAKKEFFEPGNRTMEEMNYELTIQLLSQMAGGGNPRRKDLSLYIHALMVTCVDPRNFYGRDLVSELRSIVDSGNETASSFDLLVLCNAGDTMTDKDAEKITAAFDSQHRPFWTDNQAMATMALACISTRPGVKVDERTVMDMAQELKKRQFRNGTVDNLKTTALVVQALIATQSVDRDFDLDAALRVIQNAQSEDGSIGSFLDSYYILPVLANTSLLNVTSKHCRRPTTSEAEALSELQGARGQRLVIQFSVWIGSEVDLKRTWTLKVSVNSSLYNILETVNRLDTRQQVLYNVLDGKPYVSSLMGLQDDVETGLYWFTFVRNTKDDDPTLVEESPVDVKIRPNQELILWYKSGQWNKLVTELTTQS